MPKYNSIAGRMFNITVEDITKLDIQKHLQALVDNFMNETLNIQNYHLKIPDENIKFSIKHERKPKGEIVLKLEIEWNLKDDIQSVSSKNFKIT